MVVVFLVFAYVQYNDPDPILWMGVYGGAAALTIIFPRASWARAFVPWLALGASLWGLALLWSGVSVGGLQAVIAGEDMSSPGVEELREAGGLLIITGWLFCLHRLSDRDANQGDASP